jgi:hypothetical protein
MHRLKVELVIRLDRNKPRVLSVDRLGNRFRIQEVVLVGLHEGLYELGRDQPHVMALFSQHTSEEVRPGACLYTDQGRLHVRGKLMSCFWVNFFRNSTLPVALRATR